MDHNIELSEEAKELKRKYHREWQRANKDKIAKYNKTYWENKVVEENNKIKEA